VRAPTLGGNVEVLEKPKGALRDYRVWSVWSQSPDGWWIMRRPSGGVRSSGTTNLHGCSAPRTGR
jgi:hypothetical protein